MNGIFRHLQASDFIRAAGATRLKKTAAKPQWFARRLANRDCDIVELCSRL
jgi:hypothetical protein